MLLGAGSIVLSLQCVDAILEKFKEKKTTVVAALKEAIDAVYLTVSILQFCP